jgi:hypothetical protein
MVRLGRSGGSGQEPSIVRLGISEGKLTRARDPCCEFRWIEYHFIGPRETERVSVDRVRQLLYSYRVNPGSAGRRGLK